jgi:hypothetical protein
MLGLFSKQEQRGQRGREGGRRGGLTNKQRFVCALQDIKTPFPINDVYIETNVPSIQAEHVEDDVAPVTVEYVPANVSDDEYG